MSKAIKAALLSGLIFPGVGHMYVRQYLRGSVLVVLTLIAISIIVRSLFQQALAVVDRINSGEIAANTGAITEAITRSSGGSNNLLENSALVILLACWVIGIIDSYRLGARDEKRAD